MANSRKIVIGGNWKMNLLPSDVPAYAENLKSSIPCSCSSEGEIAVRFVMLTQAVEDFRDTGIFIAAQNVREQDAGGKKGEV